MSGTLEIAPSASPRRASVTEAHPTNPEPWALAFVRDAGLARHDEQPEAWRHAGVEDKSIPARFDDARPRRVRTQMTTAEGVAAIREPRWISDPRPSFGTNRAHQRTVPATGQRIGRG